MNRHLSLAEEPWTPDPCPAWCEGHDDGPPKNTAHYSESRVIPLSLGEPSGCSGDTATGLPLPAAISLNLRRDFGAKAAVIEVCTDDVITDTGVGMTIDEAVRLGQALMDLLTAATRR